MGALEPIRRVSRRHPCPICGRDHWCTYDSERVFCMRVPSEDGRQAHNGAWIHSWPGGERPKLTVLERREPNEYLRAPGWARDRVYAALLQEASLSDRHQEALLARGLSEDEIRRHGYRTLPPGGRCELAGRVMERAGLDTLGGIPGFFFSRRWERWALAGDPGLLIPVRGIGRLVLGWQIRVDRPRGGKYVWLSSAGRPGGSSSGAPIHLAVPAVEKSPTRWIVEGPLKANICAERLGAVVLGVAGVASWREVADILEQTGAEKIVVAYDMDWATNDVVAHHRRQLVGHLLKAGFEVQVAEWDPRHKGLDDALVAGEKPVLRKAVLAGRGMS